jgi:exodeoxyribonuclease V alpha subunit
VGARARLDGELRGFTFTAEDGSYAIGTLRTSAGMVVTISGQIAHLTPGMSLALEGSWSQHKRYGKSFRVRSFLADEPRSLDGLERFLGAGEIKGIGPTLAKRIVATFGLETLRILDDAPERLSEVTGIGERKLADIQAAWSAGRTGRELRVLLTGHGVRASAARKIQERYGDRALDVVRQDPYRLAREVDGVGFRTADDIAQALGIVGDDPRRASGVALHVLRKAEGQGHAGLPAAELLGRAGELRVGKTALRQALDRELLAGRLVEPDQLVLRVEVDQRERRVAKALAARVSAARDPGDLAERAEAKTRLTLSDEQRAVVTQALSCGTCVITGGPGTGKTTLIRVLLQALADRGEDWALAAPTGRAAKRLGEACGREGKTLHRLLEYTPMAGFGRGGTKPLELDGVLVDEASMVDLDLMDALVRALPPSAGLVLVGDADQLPSVGAGAVLGDLISSGVVPVGRLTHVFRQEEGSGIVANAHRILAGDLPVSAEREQGAARDFFFLPRTRPADAVDTVAKVAVDRLKQLGFDPVVDLQILTPMYRGPLGAQALNARMQAELNPHGDELKRGPVTFRVGDRVICTRNDYDVDVFNGDVGTVTAAASAELRVDFDGREVPLVGEQINNLELAYAITIHKSQGSEYPAVIGVFDTGHHVMLRRALLYTAVTRARRFCCLIGHPSAIARAVNQAGGDERWTGLDARLREHAHR